MSENNILTETFVEAKSENVEKTSASEITQENVETTSVSEITQENAQDDATSQSPTDINTVSTSSEASTQKNRKKQPAVTRRKTEKTQPQSKDTQSKHVTKKNQQKIPIKPKVSRSDTTVKKVSEKYKNQPPSTERQKITNPAINRVARRATLKRLKGTNSANSTNVFDEFRTVMRRYMTEIVQSVVVMALHNRRETIKESDLKAALQTKGEYLGAGLNPNKKKTFSVNSNYRQKKTATEGDSDKKSRRFKPGTVAEREVKHQIKNSEKFDIPKSNFGKLTREIGAEINPEEKLRWSKNFLELFQLTVEEYMYGVMVDAKLCMDHTGRKTLKGSDIVLAVKIRGDLSN